MHGAWRVKVSLIRFALLFYWDENINIYDVFTCGAKYVNAI